MSNDTTNNIHVFTHDGVSIFKKADGSKYASCKAVISKDCKDYSLLQFAKAKVDSAKAQFDAFKVELGYKNLTTAEKDVLSKEEKRKHTILAKKIENSAELDAFNNARHDVNQIQNAIKTNVQKVIEDKLNYKDDIVHILTENGFVEEEGHYVYKFDETNGFSCEIRTDYKHSIVTNVHFYESEYKKFTDKDTNETKWHWTRGSNKASVCYDGFMESHLMFKTYNFYVSTADQFVHMESLVHTAHHIFNVMKQHEATYQMLELVDKTYEYELAS